MPRIARAAWGSDVGAGVSGETPEQKRERQRGYSRAHYNRNKEKETKRAKKWRDENPEWMAKYQREFREKNPNYQSDWVDANRDKVREYDRRCRQKNPEKHREYKRISKRNWREKNPGRDAENCKRWREKNPFVVRRLWALRRKSEGDFSPSDIEEIKLLQRNKCAYCRISFKKAKMHIDHIIALAKGGTHHRNNIQLLCQPCNQRKNARSANEFVRSEFGLLL